MKLVMKFNPKSCQRAVIPKMNPTAVSVYYPDKYPLNTLFLTKLKKYEKLCTYTKIALQMNESHYTVKFRVIL